MIDVPLGLSGFEVDGDVFPPPPDSVPLGVSSVGLEPRPFLTTPLDDFSVTEGLLLCILFVLLVGFSFLLARKK